MKRFITSIIVVCLVCLLCCSVDVEAKTTDATNKLSDKTSLGTDATLNVDKNLYPSESNISGKDININDKDLSVDIDNKTNKITISSDIYDMLNTYNNNSTNENDVLSGWNSQKSLLNSVDFSDLGKSLSSFDENDGMLNFSFANMASSLSTYQENTALDKVDSKADIFKTGYSDGIKTYFKNSFGDLSDKKDLKVDKLPSISSYTKKADKKRVSAMNSFLKSSDYKSVSSAVSVGDIFSTAKKQLNGGGKYSSPSAGSVQNSIKGAASSIDSNIKSEYNKNSNNLSSKAKNKYKNNMPDSIKNNKLSNEDKYKNYKTKIKKKYDLNDIKETTKNLTKKEKPQQGYTYKDKNGNRRNKDGTLNHNGKGWHGIK